MGVYVRTSTVQAVKHAAHTLAIRWLYAGYTLAIHWLYAGYTLLHIHTQGTQMYCIVYGCVCTYEHCTSCEACSTYAGYTLAIRWLYAGYTLAIRWLYAGYTLAIRWLYTIHIHTQGTQMYCIVYGCVCMSTVQAVKHAAHSPHRPLLTLF